MRWIPLILGHGGLLGTALDATLGMADLYMLGDRVGSSLARGKALGLNTQVMFQLVGNALSAALAMHMAAVLPTGTGHCITQMEQYEEDIVRQPLVVQEGFARLPEAPGLGLEIDDDALSYDIFSAVGRVVREPGVVGVLGGLSAERLIATGHSQSASRLSIYLNNVHPRAPVYDAVVVHGGGSRIRQDQDVLIWKLMAEGDMVTRAATRQSDTDTFRSWEVAGSSHVDIFFRIESSRVAALEAGRQLAAAEVGSPDCEYPSYSRVPFRYVLHAAFDVDRCPDRGGDRPRVHRGIPAGRRQRILLQRRRHGSHHGCLA